MRFSFLSLLGVLPFVWGATSAQWKSRSIYQLVTDRFAPATAGAACDPTKIKYCGGTWATITSHLDYIQSLGFTAIWISPTSEQINSTIYGEAFHGYWPVNHLVLNPHFGDADSLLALSKAVHSRGMYLMVDLVLNHLASLSTTITNAQLAKDTGLQYTQQANYHPPCAIDYNNQTSILNCWFSLEGYVLMDVATETAAIRNATESWVKAFVTKYSVDGLRLDREEHLFAKDMDDTFLKSVCAAAGVFCTGEVGTSDTSYAARFQTAGVLDSVLSYPMWYGLVDTFAQNQSMNVVAYDMYETQTHFTDPQVLCTWLENHDQVRFRNMTQDDSLVYNALVASFMFEGIPIVYYGFELNDASGPDPLNRAALWLKTNYTIPTDKSSTSQRIIKLNKLRTALGPSWISANSTRENDSLNMAMTRGQSLTVLSNRGAKGSGEYDITSHPFTKGESVVDVLSCNATTVNSNGTLKTYFKQGLPMVFLSATTASSSGLC
ncbi:hypothetical protein P7C73_g5632, partial [Tremellales sp. Uapishka_1]